MVIYSGSRSRQTNRSTKARRKCLHNFIGPSLRKVRPLKLKHIAIQGMVITLVRYFGRNIVQVTLAKFVITPLVLIPQGQAEYGRQSGSSEQNPGTDPHARGVPGLVRLGKQPRAKDRPTLANHTEDGKAGTALGSRALVVSHPGEGEGHRWEDARADQEGREVAGARGVDGRQDHIAGGARAAEEYDEDAASPETVGDEAGCHADNVGGQVGAGGEALGAEGGVSHGLEDGWEVGRQGAEGGVEAEDDHSLQVVLVIPERSKCLLDVEFPISLFASTLEGALTDDLVLSVCKEAAFGWRGREVKVGNDSE